ncbi:hypothetical protein F8154_05795 [Alkaliphilus pronyensis]|uniref:Uncharacterized protein n=1 Tax=Alkaliphilus pronyensis TaxID=1482732 RepID=A0A6I0FA10_9FIRM|nr:hypothetical protein [Alkaliphilus pronyensis]KAB3535643.1 hypothetical protein F8154_05795 [Alkaliphilus pronyensis]
MKNIANYNKLIRTSVVLMTALMIINMGGIFVYADPGWGKNAFDFVKEIAWWAALTAIVVFVVKFIAKRAWVQLGGFLLLSGIVLVIIDGPERLKNIALTVWTFIFGA